MTWSFMQMECPKYWSFKFFEKPIEILLSARYSLDTLEKSEEVFSVLNLLLVFVIVVQLVVWHSFRTTH
jgi:hypothetical protein